MGAHRKLLEALAFFGEFPHQFFADGKTLLGEANRGLHHAGKLHGAVSFQSQCQPGNRAGHGNGAKPNRRGLLIERAVGLDVHIARGPARSHFTVVEECGFALSEANQHKSAATDVPGRRLDNREGECRGDGRVHGIAAALQYFHPHL